MRKYSTLLRFFSVGAVLLSCCSCAEKEAVTDKAVQSNTEEKEGKVLRHAVFFAFKESSTPEQIDGVVTAFRSLREKISSVRDLKSGTNNSPEKLDDGFTHCFFLTFDSEAGRDEYLPHPEHKKFGDVLRPHMSKAFVVDFWGSPLAETLPELKHCVFFKFKDDAAKEDIKKVEVAFEALASKIDTIRSFEWGTNNSPEKYDEGFTHCFIVGFHSEEDRAAYLPHADHKAFVELLGPVLDKARVLDFWDRPGDAPTSATPQ